MFKDRILLQLVIISWFPQVQPLTTVLSVASVSIGYTVVRTPPDFIGSLTSC